MCLDVLGLDNLALSNASDICFSPSFVSPMHSFIRKVALQRQRTRHNATTPGFVLLGGHRFRRIPHPLFRHIVHISGEFGGWFCFLSLVAVCWMCFCWVLLSGKTSIQSCGWHVGFQHAQRDFQWVQRDFHQVYSSSTTLRWASGAYRLSKVMKKKCPTNLKGRTGNSVGTEILKKRSLYEKKISLVW